MAVKFFGQFLVEQDLISAADLLKAIELQESTNRKIGELVCDLGLMTPGQVDQVHQVQRHEDIRFGDKAIELGFLTEEQLQQALTLQRNSHLYIGEALVKTGAFAEKELDDYLERFHRDQQPYRTGKIELPDEVGHQPVWELVADLTYKMLIRVANINYHPDNCRLVDQLPPRPLVAQIHFNGDLDAQYLLSASPNSRRLIARSILQQEDIDDETTEILDDAVLEFANIACGNIAAKAAQFGFQLDITPPAIHPQATTGICVPDDHIGLLFPIHMSDGEQFELAIFFRQDQG